MDFENIFKFLLENFKKDNIHYALIGGLALAASGYARATQDIDFLIDKKDLPKIKQMLAFFQYDLIHESEDVANFLGKIKIMGRIDFLLAHRRYAKAMLIRAKDKKVFGGKFNVKVVTPEDLIGLKVQSSVNDPDRYHQDMADIEELIRANYDQLNMDLVNEYFEIFKKTDELKQLLERINNAKQTRKK